MNADLTKRLFKAIALGSDKDLERLCRKVIEEESGKGHSVLANQLESIMKTRKSIPNPIPKTDSERVLQTLPTSRRYQDPLVVRLDRESLRHFMVLPKAVEERFARIEKEYAARERLASFGLKHKKKILLYGHPGCGKTLGAERIAWTTGLPLVKVRFDALISSYLGESGINLRAVFESVRERPCVLFLDECDFIAKSRNSNNDVGEIPRLVNTLLQLLEEFDGPGLLVAATNLDKQLDKALFRRFDDVFEVLAPGKHEIERLVKSTLAAIPLSKTIHWTTIVEKLLGMSAAEVVKVAQDAAKNTVLSGRELVSEADLTEVISEVYNKE